MAKRRVARWKKDNRERVITHRRAWRAKHIKRIREYGRKWVAKKRLKEKLRGEAE